MPNDRLAQVAYSAYADSLHHPMDEWDELSPDLKDAWRSVADTIVMAIGERSDLIQDDPDDDSRSRAVATGSGTNKLPSPPIL